MSISTSAGPVKGKAVLGPERDHLAGSEGRAPARALSESPQRSPGAHPAESTRAPA